MLKRWRELPKFMRTEEVRPYYESLRNHRKDLCIKRIFDFVVSTFLIIFLIPAFILLALAIKMDSQGPVFYRQERVTQYGKLFKIYKFRTMVQEADQIGSLVTRCRDPRITRVGKRLREYRLDELPQLINIWKGEMTFVGTRPEVPKYVRSYSKEMYATLLLPAGVTSETSIYFKDEKELLNVSADAEIDALYINNILKDKMSLNLKCLMNFSFFNDLIVMLKTIHYVTKSNSSSSRKMSRGECGDEETAC